LAHVGGATAYLFDADDLKQFGMRWMELNYKKSAESLPR
jgi:hypothetical protein